MKTKRFLLGAVCTALIFALFACSTDDPAGGDNNGNNNNNNNAGANLYCDYGPVTQYGGGCFKIANENECDLEWGKVVSSCPSNSTSSSSSNNTPSSPSNNTTPSSSSAEKPSKMTIELVYYREFGLLDPGLISSNGDPKITVNVKSYIGDAVVKNVTTGVLLDKEDIADWTGSVKSTVEIYPTADKIVIQPIILDKDVTSNDNVSPDAKSISKDQIFAGRVFSNQIFSNTKVSCTLNISLIK